MAIYYERSVNVMTVNDLPFTVREGRAITDQNMPIVSATDRLRAALQRLVKQDGHGAQAALSRFSHTRPGGSKILPGNLSYFIHKTRKNPLSLSDLDDIAAYFRVSIGELFDSPRPAELNGDEQRLVYAFRALPRPTQEHFMALIEASSVAFSASDKRLLDRLHKGKPLEHNPVSLKDVSHGGAVPHSADDLAALRQRASSLALELARFATGGSQPPALSNTETG